MALFTTLVSFGYKARHGKGTAAQAILSRWGGTYDIREYPFSAALKAEVNALDQRQFCIEHGIGYDTSPDRTDPLCQTEHGKQSKLLQFYGQYKRAQDSYFWVRKLDAAVKRDKPAVALITDMRHLNEYYYVRSNNGYNIKCNRLGFVDPSRDPNHVSETELDGRADWDFEISVLDSDEGREELKKDALIVFDVIMSKLNVTFPDLEELNAAA